MRYRLSRFLIVNFIHQNIFSFFEVFGNIRATCGPNEKPRTSNFLQLMRLLLSYNFSRTVANTNVDGKDGLSVLSDADEFVRCSRTRLKERKKEMVAEEEYMRMALEMRWCVNRR